MHAIQQMVDIGVSLQGDSELGVGMGSDGASALQSVEGGDKSKHETKEARVWNPHQGMAQNDHRDKSICVRDHQLSHHGGAVHLCLIE
jgi:hypothetical protein